MRRHGHSLSATVRQQQRLPVSVNRVENDANRFLEIVVVLKSLGMTITI
jgi:hypothetical protein